MFNKIEKYLYIVSPLLILAGLFYYYITGKFEVVSAVIISLGIVVGMLFIFRFYDSIVQKVTKRKVRYGINSLLISVVVIALVVIVYLVTMNHNKRTDLTKVRRFSLSDQTIKVLEKLEKPVQAYAFYGKHQDTTSIRDLFNEYRYNYRDFNFELIDPDVNPGMVKDMGVEEYGELILKYGEKTEKVKVDTEEGITNSLIKLSQTGVKNVYFISGHGEHSIEDYSNIGYDKIKASIANENFQVKDVLLLREERVPEDASVLISAGPAKDYEPYEIDLIDRYIMDGGRVLFLMDPESGDGGLKNIASLLERYGLILGNDVIIDPLSRVLSGDFFMPVINTYTYNPITKNFNIAIFLRLARSIQTMDNAGENIFTREVAQTGETSWAEKDLKNLLSGKGAEFNEGVDLKGPVTIMAYSTVTLSSGEEKEEGETGEVEKEKEGIVLAIGDSDFINNAMYQTQGNKDLFLNTVNFLADRGELISVRPKQEESVFLTMTTKQGRLAFLVTVILTPLFVILIGLYINIQRRVKA